MTGLDDLLRPHVFGQRTNSRADKQAVTHAIAAYLDSHPAVTSFEIQEALIPLVPDRYDRSALSTPNSNPFIAQRTSFSHAPLADAVKRFLHQMHPGSDVVVHYGEGRARAIVYYRTEAGLQEYLSARLRERQEVHYDFAVHPSPKETPRISL